MPATLAVPDVGASSPHNRRIIVVLPEPLGPSMPNNSPVRIDSEALSTAVNAPKRRVNESTTTAFSTAIVMARRG